MEAIEMTMGNRVVGGVLGVAVGLLPVACGEDSPAKRSGDVGGAGGADAAVVTQTGGGGAGEGGTGGNVTSDAGAADAGGTLLSPTVLLALAAQSPLGQLPDDPTNAYADDPAAAALGQMLFFDAALSGPLAVDSDLGLTGETGRVACASCHSGPYMDDQRSEPRNVSLGAGFHSRNAPPLVNSAFYPWTNWGGRFASQWELPIPVSEAGVIMNGNRLRTVHRIFDAYRAEYEAIFGALEPAIGADLVRFPLEGKPKPPPSPTNPTPPDGVWEAMAPADQVVVNRVMANFGKVLQAYIRTLVSRDAPFDRFIAGDTGALDRAEQRGALVFVTAGRCVECHSGPHFSDGLFHNLGVPQSGDHVPPSDDGRFKDVPGLLGSPFNPDGAYSDDTSTGRLDGLTNPMPESALGAFRTPSLRGVALTAPYMHSGQLATLEDVVNFYNAGGDTPVNGTRSDLIVPLGLTEEQKADLVAFLHTLTGADVPAERRLDTAKP